MSGRHVLAIRRTSADGDVLVTIEAVAREAGLHPELAQRLIALGALEPAGGTTGQRLFPRDAAARLARIARLRRDLGLNYAGAVLACDLLARIEALEEAVSRAGSRPTSRPPEVTATWTRTS